jgi:type IV pilus assembly protein PilA
MKKKGFTLIELLAVIVIMGIILAIAIPSTVGIIDKSKRDVHVKNAQVMASTVKTVMIQEEDAPVNEGDGIIYTMKYLSDNGYLPKFKDPDGGDYDDMNTYVVVVKTESGFKYYVQLDGNTRDIGLSLKTEALDLTSDQVGLGTIREVTDTANIKSDTGITMTTIPVK